MGEADSYNETVQHDEAGGIRATDPSAVPDLSVDQGARLAHASTARPNLQHHGAGMDGCRGHGKAHPVDVHQD